MSENIMKLVVASISLFLANLAVSKKMKSKRKFTRQSVL